jgi:hypothetical protein
MACLSVTRQQIAGAGALDEGDAAGRLAVGGTRDAARGGELLHLDVGHDVLAAAVAQVAQAGRVVGLPAGGLNDGADAELGRFAVGAQ